MKITEGLTGSRGILQWIVATLLAVATTALLAWLGANSTTAGMVFLVLVVWSATQSGVALSLYIAILCALSFDYFFLLPFHTFVLAGAQEWVAMCSFAASSLVAGRVAERARRQSQHAEQRREDVERLYTLSQEMMLHEDAAGLIRELPRMIERIFGLENVALYVHGQDQFCSTHGELSDAVKTALRELTGGQQWAFEAPEGFSAQALMLGMRPVGALGWRPGILSREVATAVSAQVAIALTRAVALEASARIEVSREGERLRTALIDSLTHELRTPLTSIRAAATTLMQGEGLDDAGRLDLATIVDEESSRLDALIGEAVEMAEITANAVQVHAVPQRARTLLELAVERSQKKLAPHHVEIDVEEPDTTVWFDPLLLGRVFRHVLENAARYSPPGGRIVVRSWRAEGWLEFSVQDSGPGIDAVDLPRIFEKFYRGKRGAASRKGSGMGLAIARAIVNAHGGEIEALSTPEQGATFRFWVPLVEKEPSSARG